MPTGSDRLPRSLVGTPYACPIIVISPLIGGSRAAGRLTGKTKTGRRSGPFGLRRYSGLSQLPSEPQFLSAFVMYPGMSFSQIF